MTPIPATKFRHLASARRTVCGIREDDRNIACFGARMWVTRRAATVGVSTVSPRAAARIAP